MLDKKYEIKTKVQRSHNSPYEQKFKTPSGYCCRNDN